MAADTSAPRVEAIELPASGTRLLPLLVYRQVVPLDGDTASTFETLFARHGWGGGWRNGIFGYDHFHATTHEVLGIARGRVRVRFGGDKGIEAEVSAGDVVVVPAGVAHRNLKASRDLLVVGAYPDGRNPDRNTGTPDQSPLAAAEIRRVPVPSADPVYGQDGPLRERWRAAGA
jgi:uncharacterized protein YjlB